MQVEKEFVGKSSVFTAKADWKLGDKSQKLLHLPHTSLWSQQWNRQTDGFSKLQDLPVITVSLLLCESQAHFHHWTFVSKNYTWGAWVTQVLCPTLDMGSVMIPGWWDQDSHWALCWVCSLLKTLFPLPFSPTHALPLPPKKRTTQKPCLSGMEVAVIEPTWPWRLQRI